MVTFQHFNGYLAANSLQTSMPRPTTTHTGFWTRYFSIVNFIRLRSANKKELVILFVNYMTSFKTDSIWFLHCLIQSQCIFLPWCNRAAVSTSSVRDVFCTYEHKLSIWFSTLIPFFAFVNTVILLAVILLSANTPAIVTHSQSPRNHTIFWNHLRRSGRVLIRNSRRVVFNIGILSIASTIPARSVGSLLLFFSPCRLVTKLIHFSRLPKSLVVPSVVFIGHLRSVLTLLNQISRPQSPCTYQTFQYSQSTRAGPPASLPPSFGTSYLYNWPPNLVS